MPYQLQMYYTYAGVFTILSIIIVVYLIRISHDKKPRIVKTFTIDSSSEPYSITFKRSVGFWGRFSYKNLTFFMLLNDLERDKTVSYTHLRAHETRHDLVCRLLLEKKK